MSLQPLAEATRVLVPALWVYVALACVTLARAGLFFLDVVTRLRGSAAFTWTTVLTGDARLFAGLGALVELAVLILFLWWVYRANRNLRALSGRDLEFTPGWAVGWFFIPFANLVQPYRVVRELWECSHGGQTGAGGRTVGWWWGALVGGIVLGWAASYAGGQIHSGAGWLTYVSLHLAVALLDLAEALLLVTVVKGIAAGYAASIREPDPDARSSTPQTPVAAGSAVEVAAWYADPTGRHEVRYWDGVAWSSMVADAGTVGIDPL